MLPTDQIDAAANEPQGSGMIRRIGEPPSLPTLVLVIALLALVLLYGRGGLDQLLGNGSDRAAGGTPLINSQPSDQMIGTDHLIGYGGAWYHVYFTQPSYPERAADRVGGLDEAIVADLEAAQRRIEVAVFDLDLPRLVDALLRAAARGVAVRVSIDGEHLAEPAVAAATGQLEAAGVALFYDDRPAFMHNKIVVIDDAIVWTGSANFTINDVFRNNNNMLRIVSPELAANYAAKTEDVFTGNGGTNGASVMIHPALQIGDAQLVNAFSPDDDVTDLIVERLSAAQQSIRVLAFAFTSDPIGQELIAAQERGLTVSGVMESRNTKGSGSQFEVLRRAGVDLLADGNCYIMHHKLIVIDGRTVITGSFNFTRAAQDSNDENVLIIDDPELAARYLDEFERVAAQARSPMRCQ